MENKIFARRTYEKTQNFLVISNDTKSLNLSAENALKTNFQSLQQINN